MCSRGGQGNNKKRITVAEWLMMTNAEREIWAGSKGITNLRLVADSGIPALPADVDWDVELRKLPRTPEGE